MKRQIIALGFIFSSSLLFAAPPKGESAPPLPAVPPSQTGQTPTMLQLEADVSTVSFMPRSSTLHNIDKKDLREFMKPLLNQGAPKRIIIAAWGDKAEDKKNVKAGDRGIDSQEELAEARAATLKETLIGLGGKNVDIYNMARPESQIGEVTGTGGGLIKDALLQVGKKDIAEGAQGPGKNQEQRAAHAENQGENQPLATKIKANGGFSKALIILQSEPVTAGR